MTLGSVKQKFWNMNAIPALCTQLSAPSWYPVIVEGGKCLLHGAVLSLDYGEWKLESERWAMSSLLLCSTTLNPERLWVAESMTRERNVLWGQWFNYLELVTRKGKGSMVNTKSVFLLETLNNVPVLKTMLLIRESCNFLLASFSRDCYLPNSYIRAKNFRACVCAWLHGDRQLSVESADEMGTVPRARRLSCGNSSFLDATYVYITCVRHWCSDWKKGGDDEDYGRRKMVMHC